MIFFLIEVLIFIKTILSKIKLLLDKGICFLDNKIPQDQFLDNTWDFWIDNIAFFKDKNNEHFVKIQYKINGVFHEDIFTNKEFTDEDDILPFLLLRNGYVNSIEEVYEYNDEEL